METIDLYIDASFNDKRKNGKCAAILIHDEKEYQWSMGMTSERIHNNWPCQGTINSTEYEISTLIFFLKYLNDRKISNSKNKKN